MAKVVGDIAIAVGADITPLQKGMKKASGSVGQFQKDTAAMAKNMVKAGALVATAAAGIATGILAAGKQAAAAATEIKNLSNVANAGVVEFQKMAVASESVGISQEKLSDILKDVNDRIGDFIATGGGPMKDFFENIAPAIGVTIDQFKTLSGPEALQLYVSSLEKANLSQADMTFYMEAMASDTTALIPLLANGGRQMRALGDEAERTGRVLDEELIQNGVELDKVLRDASGTISTSFNKAILDNADAIGNLAEFISDDLIPAAGDLLTVISDIVSGAQAGIQTMEKLFGLGEDVRTYTPAPYEGQAADDAWRKAEIDAINSGAGLYLDENGEIIELGMPETVLPGTTSVKGGSSGGGSAKGGRSSGPTEADLEQMQERFATEAEYIEIANQEALERLREFRENKIGTEEEFNELERRITEEHEQAKSDLERKEQSVRLQAISGAFGQISSLMTSENKKLFEIGKAAATAEAVVSGYKSAVSAWEKGMSIGGPPMAAAFTAGSLAKTGALIASIQSQSIGGSSNSASAGGGSVATPSVAETASSSSAVNIDFGGASYIPAEAAIAMLKKINEVAGDGLVIRSIQ